MISLPRFAIAFALLICALAVFPQQPRAQSSLAEKQAIEGNPVKRPFVEVGDCWTYRKTFLSIKDKPPQHYTLCVTHIDYTRDVIFTAGASGGEETYGEVTDGKGQDNLYTTEWNRRVGGDVRTSTPRFLQFPLHVGDTYSFEYEYRVLTDLGRLRKKKWDMKVVGWDDVTIPAGTFRAVRIEGIGFRMDSRHPPSQLTTWYAPEVNRYVKEIEVQPSGTIVRELTKYRLKQ